MIAINVHHVVIKTNKNILSFDDILFKHYSLCERKRMLKASKYVPKTKRWIKTNINIFMLSLNHSYHVDGENAQIDSLRLKPFKVPCNINYVLLRLLKWLGI